MNNWEQITLNDISTISSGKSVKYEKELNLTYPVLGSNGQIGTLNDYNFEKGYLLGRVGAAGSVQKITSKVWASDNTLTIKLYDGKTDFNFMEYLLKYLDYGKYATKTAQPLITQSILKQVKFSLPPLKEQQKIAEILSSVDAAIEKTEQVIAKTEEVKKGLMQQILTKGIGHTEFKQTEIGEIPVGWNVINLEEICSLITYGFTNPMPTTDEGPYMITAKDIRDGDIQYKTARKTSMECYSNDLTDKSRPSIGDILITKDGTLGRLAIVKQEDICINQSVARIVLKDINLVKYIYYLLDSPQVQTRILAESGGSTIKHIYITKLAKTLIPISTDVEETKNITNILDSYDYKISSEKRKCNYLINIKKGLMQQLLTGQVRVKID